MQRDEPFKVSRTITPTIKPKRTGHNWNQTIAIAVLAAATIYVLAMMRDTIADPLPEQVQTIVQTPVPVEQSPITVNVVLEQPTATPTPEPTATATPEPSTVDLYGVCGESSQPGDVCVNPTATPNHNVRVVMETPVSLMTCDLAAMGSVCIVPTPAGLTEGDINVGS